MAGAHILIVVSVTSLSKASEDFFIFHTYMYTCDKKSHILEKNKIKTLTFVPIVIIDGRFTFIGRRATQQFQYYV